MLKEQERDKEKALTSLKQIRDSWGMDDFTYAGVVHLINVIGDEDVQKDTSMSSKRTG